MRKIENIFGEKKQNWQNLSQIDQRHKTQVIKIKNKNDIKNQTYN